jgi:hypothetical protein
VDASGLRNRNHRQAREEEKSTEEEGANTSLCHHASFQRHHDVAFPEDTESHPHAVTTGKAM